jgi:hypothetical protein
MEHITFVGLDVHKGKTSVAIAEPWSRRRSPLPGRDPEHPGGVVSRGRAAEGPAPPAGVVPTTLRAGRERTRA